MKNVIKTIKSSIPILVTYSLSYIVIISGAIMYVILGYKDLDFFITNICSHIINIYYFFWSYIFNMF